MANPGKSIASWEDAQQQVPAVLAQLAAQPALALAAAANPLLALEELGYTIEPAARGALEDRVRLGAAGALRLQRLRERIFEKAGRPFDLSSGAELQRVLFTELHLGSGAGAAGGASALSAEDLAPLSAVPTFSPAAPPAPAGAAPPPPHPSGQEAAPASPSPAAATPPSPKLAEATRPAADAAPPAPPAPADPLAVLAGAHPIVEPLLEYRRLDASQPRLAERSVYTAVRQGRQALPISRIHWRLQSPPSAQGGGANG